MLFWIISFIIAADENTTCPFIVNECAVYVNNSQELVTNQYYNVSFDDSCELNFVNCKINGCYSFIDMTSSYRVGYAPNLANSIFDNYSNCKN